MQTWLKLRRAVKKGEKGIAILAPTGRPKPDAPGEGTRNAAKEDHEDEPPVRFRDAYVLDVEQTEGEPLPEF